MRIQLRFVILALSTLLPLAACQQSTEFPVKLTVPKEAAGVRVDENADRSISELAFVVSIERNSYLVADDMESQLTKGGYVRCSSGGARRETLRRRQGEQEIEEIRLLRFYKTNDPRQLGTILANEYCKESQSKCEQRFTVRQINVSQSIAEGDKYIREICK